MPKWRRASGSRWRSRHDLTDRLPTSFQEVLDAVAVFADPVLTDHLDRHRLGSRDQILEQRCHRVLTPQPHADVLMPRRSVRGHAQALGISAICQRAGNRPFGRCRRGS